MTTIRLYQKADLKYVDELYVYSYGRSRSPEKFNWEYINSPAGPSIYVVAFDEERNIMVGTVAAIPFILRNSKGSKTTSAKIEDLLIHPDYRGKKLFDEMYALLLSESLTKGITHFWAFTYAVKPFIRVGFQVPFRINLGMLVTNVTKAFEYLKGLNPKNTKLDRVKIFLFTIYAWFNGLKRKTIKSNSLLFNLNESVVTDLNQLLSDSSDEDMFYLSQDAFFMNWRIYNNPYISNFNQRSLIDAKGRLYCNLIYNSANGIVNIVQNIYSKGLDSKSIAAFLRFTLKDICQNSNVIRYWGFQHNEISRNDLKILKSLGFTFSNRGIPFVWKDLGNEFTLEPNQLLLSRMASQGKI